jgi:hypothetical protein
MEPNGRGKKTLGRNGRGERKNHVLTPVENAAKKETGNKTLGWNGLRERNNQVIAPVEDAVKKEEQENYWKQWTERKEQSGAYSNGRCSQKEEGRKLSEAMEGEQGTITCSLQWKMQLTRSGKKTLGRNGMKIIGRGKRHNQLLTEMEDASKRKSPQTSI